MRVREGVREGGRSERVMEARRKEDERMTRFNRHHFNITQLAILPTQH